MAKNELDIIKNIEGIKQNLDRGTRKIKGGHFIKRINPEGREIEVPLTSNQIQNRIKKLAEQEKALLIGLSSRKSYWYINKL